MMEEAWVLEAVGRRSEAGAGQGAWYGMVGADAATWGGG